VGYAAKRFAVTRRSVLVTALLDVNRSVAADRRRQFVFRCIDN